MRTGSAAIRAEVQLGSPCRRLRNACESRLRSRHDESRDRTSEDASGPRSGAIHNFFSRRGEKRSFTCCKTNSGRSSAMKCPQRSILPPWTSFATRFHIGVMSPRNRSPPHARTGIASFFLHVLKLVICDRPAPVMTSESDFVVPQSCDELIDIRGEGSFVIAVDGTFAVAQAAQIRGDDGEVLRH